MPVTKVKYTNNKKQIKLGRRKVIWPLTILAIILFSVLIFLLQAKIISYEELSNNIEVSHESSGTKGTGKAFPLGVNPKMKTVTEIPNVNNFLDNQVVSNHTNSQSPQGWFAMIREKLSASILYQNLASPISRTLIIESGDRSEEVAGKFTHILGWDQIEKTDFIKRIKEQIPEATNGKLYPGTYVINKDATPEQVSAVINDRFDSLVRSHYTNDIEAIVPIKDTLIIASLLEREAYDFEDMRYISGIIWNRLFIGMKLQIDATLQFARGSQDSTNWWPVPVPNDKYIKSPYNTYKNVGLPPEPIANPSIDAIIAALNPRKTDCLFYFHDNSGKFYCSKTYEEHVASLKKVFGQGK